MRLLIWAVIASGFFCHNSSLAQMAGSSTLPHVLVYKAKAKYRDLVPVQLSSDRKSIVSYPAPSDVTTGSGFLLPVALHNGYWLDKIGVGPNTAYLKYNYKEYSRLKMMPPVEELYKMIVDKAPITEICDCGVRNAKNTSVKYLNSLIDKKLLKKNCKTFK